MDVADTFVSVDTDEQFSIWCERETRGQRTVRGSLTLDVPVWRWPPYICFRDTYKWHYLTHCIPLVRFTQHASGDADNLEQHGSDVYSLGRHSSDVIRVGHHECCHQSGATQQ
ncbi:uncharacterized protein [Panulirus ornatus]|uniref:uncharacterized protein n=1 Tax=Panulirus ornatus TaxID=150431 RepID=UPI003A87BC72